MGERIGGSVAGIVTGDDHLRPGTDVPDHVRERRLLGAEQQQRQQYSDKWS